MSPQRGWLSTRLPSRTYASIRVPAAPPPDDVGRGGGDTATEGLAAFRPQAIPLTVTSPSAITAAGITWARRLFASATAAEPLDDLGRDVILGIYGHRGVEHHGQPLLFCH